jgi:ribosome maturation factor RimP
MDKKLVSELWEIIEPVLEPDNIELVELEIKFDSGKRVLRLYIDSDRGITLDDCEYVSRQVSALLDLKDPIEQAYTLEVSSPGINRVLRRQKDFDKYAGSPVRIKTREKVDGRRNFIGTLKGTANNEVILDVEGMKVELHIENIEKARLDLPESELFREDLRRGVGTGD